MKKENWEKTFSDEFGHLSYNCKNIHRGDYEDLKQFIASTIKQEQKKMLEAIVGEVEIEKFINSAIYFGRINKIKGADREKKATKTSKLIKTAIKQKAKEYIKE